MAWLYIKIKFNFLYFYNPKVSHDIIYKQLHVYIWQYEEKAETRQNTRTHDKHLIVFTTDNKFHCFWLTPDIIQN